MLPALIALYAPTAAAHAESEGVALHVGYDYDSCYIDLHPELTQDQFGRFARKFMDTAPFLAMAGAETIGAGHVRLGVTYSQSFVDDAEPEWNNTFTHPGDDHWLGQPAIPMLSGRVGLPAKFDVELMGTSDLASNWGLGAAAVRRVIITQSETIPVSLAARASYEHLFGPPEVNVDGAAIESLVSRRFGPFSPYAGAAVTASLASEQTNELSLDPALSFGGRGVVGTELNFGWFHASAQGTWASVPSVALQVGGTI